MDYKKAYEEALERAKKLYKEAKENDWTSDIEDYEEIFPELRESEDERIRKEIIKTISWIVPDCQYAIVLPREQKNEWLAWLEKQKEASEAIEAAERIESYITEHTANSWEMDDSNPDKKYYCGVDDTLADIDVIVKDVYAKHKEQKPNIELIQRSWYMEGYHDREFGKEPKWVIKTGEGGPKHELNPNYGQFLAEQKPVTKFKVGDKVRFKSDGVDILTITGLREDAYLTDSAYGPILFSNQDEWEIVEQKPVKWSEEDEKCLQELMQHIEHCVAVYGAEQPEWQRWLNLLNSLRPQPKQEWKHYIWAYNLKFNEDALVIYEDNGECELVRKGNRPRRNVSGTYVLIKDVYPQPHWKPTEEQMDSLNYGIYVLEEEGYDASASEIKELYEQLKKLMEE